MNVFTEKLAPEIAAYYRNLALGHGVIPKIFTLVNAQSEQYLFFLDDLDLDEEAENDFLAYIVNQHDAITYARGTLVVLEDEMRQLIEFAVIDKDDPNTIVCSAELTRDADDKPVQLSEFKKMFAPAATVYFSGLYQPVQLSADQLEEYSELWEEMKPKILHRYMLEQ